MTYYGFSSDEMEWRQSHFKKEPGSLGIFSREHDKRRSEGIGKGWSSMKTREHVINFKALGADWTYENDGGFVLGFLRNHPGPLSRGQPATSPPCDTCAELSDPYDTLRTSPKELSAASETCKVCGLLSQACRDSGATDEEEVQATVRMNTDGVAFLMLRVGSGILS